MKSGDEKLVSVYEELLSGTDIQLVPMDGDILRAAASLRAATSLRTPDAIHAATALSTGCALFITNDNAFRSLDGVPVLLLSSLT